MSKLVTQRFEYVLYDDASGTLVPPKGTPPTYPPVLDNYSTTSTASAAQSYGAFTMSSTGSAQPLTTPPGATIVLIGASSNTTNVMLSQTAVALTPGGGMAPLGWPVGPGQIVSFPGSLNSGTFSVQACDGNYNLVTAAFNINVMWSI